MIDIVPNVHKDANVKPASVITRVSPSCSGVNILGTRTNKLNAPNAKPARIIRVDRMLFFWIIPMDGKYRIYQ